jgi:hypothetical protein
MLTAGVSPAITVTGFTATSRITALYSDTPVFPLGTLVAKLTDRTATTFKITSIDPATGTTIGTDVSSVEWVLIDTGN